MKKSTKWASITVLAAFLLLLGIGVAFGDSSSDATRPAWTPASYYAAAARGSAGIY